MAKATAPKTPSSYDYVALSVNDKKSGSPTNRIQLVMRNWRKRHLPKLETTGAGIFAPTHKHRPSSFWGWESFGENLKRCRLQKSAQSFDLKLSIHIGSHLSLLRRKNEKGKRSRFFKVAGNSIFCVLHIFSHSRIVCFLLANVILFVNINPSRWGTLNYDWGGREYKKHSKYQYCPESSNRTHHLPIKKTFQPAIIRSVCHFH